MSLSNLWYASFEFWKHKCVYLLLSKSEGEVIILGCNFSECFVLQNSKGILVKAVGVVDACADTVFEIVLNPDRHRRYE